MKFFQMQTIYGCDARGDGDKAYLTRHMLVEGRFGRICLHWFHRSDAEDEHDHPWNFLSIVLWRGYIEQTPSGRHRKWPGFVMFRRAEHRHRVELVNGKPALTLCIMSPKKRDWGFFTVAGWQYWRHYFKDRGC